MSARLVAALVLLLAGEARGAAPPWVAEAMKREPASPRDLVVLDAQKIVVFQTSDHARVTYRWVAKLWRESGRKKSFFSVDYNADDEPVVAAAAWVVTPSGHSRTYHRYDFVDFSTDPEREFWSRSRRLQFAAGDRMQPGDVVAVEITTDERGIFEFGERFADPVLTLHHSLDVLPVPGDSLVWHATSPSLNPPTPGGAAGGLHWDDVPPVPDEDRQPSHFLANPRAILVRDSRSPLEGGWLSASALADSIIRPRMVCPAALQARVEALTSASSNRWDKVRALADFAQQQIVYLSLTDDTDSYAGMRPHFAADIAANRFGDCKDKATLLVTMLRAIGVDARVLLVTAEDPKAIEPDWPTLDFNHAIVAIAAAGAPAGWPSIDAGPLGRMVVFDPTNPVAPLGILSQSDQGGWSLLVDAQYGRLLRLPMTENAEPLAATEIDGELSPTGEVTAVCERDFRDANGAERYDQRRSERREDIIAAWNKGLESFMRLPHIVSWNDQWSPTEATYHIHMGYRGLAGRWLGDSLMALSPQFARGTPEINPWSTRAEGVAWMPAQSFQCHSHLKLPTGWVVEETPDNWSRQGKTIHARISYQFANGYLDYNATFLMRPGFCDRAQYEKIRTFIEKVETAERRPVILRRKAAPPVAADHS